MKNENEPYRYLVRPDDFMVFELVPGENHYRPVTRNNPQPRFIGHKHNTFSYLKSHYFFPIPEEELDTFFDICERHYKREREEDDQRRDELSMDED